MGRILRLLVLILMLTGTPATAQVIRSFTPDSLIYIQELTLLFDQIANKENNIQAEITLQKFAELWQSESYDYITKQKIYTLSNLMLKKRLKPFPDFEMVLRVLVHFKNATHNEEELLVWLDGTTQSLQNRRSTKFFRQVIQSSILIFEKDVLYESRIFSWSYTLGDYQFKYDTNFYILFSNINLHCKSKKDSTTIYGTSGVFFIMENTWHGSSGKITWERAGFSKDSVYAILPDYNIKFKTSSFIIESASFYNLNYFPGPLLGTITEKVKSEKVTAKKALYPYFQSYAKTLFIPGLFTDVDYEGGFALKGSKIMGGGDEFSAAQLTFKRPYRDKNGKYDLLVARSKVFIIEPDRINSSNAAIAIYHQEDSIFHSGLQFKYMHNKREVSLLRIEKGVMESPYADTYHDVEIDCEAVYWKMDESKIRFRSLAGVQRNSNALFISNKYFEVGEFDLLQGMDFIHPLVVIYNFAQKYNRNKFYVYELAEYMNMPVYQVELQVIRLAKYGFLYYGADNEMVLISDKLYHYLNAKKGTTDYDVISFFSQVYNEDNATLSLDNFDLKIKGVPRVSISDSQNVYIYPTRGEVILRKNRDFLFSGKIQAGLFEFNANDCFFEYDTFRLVLPTIESMKFKILAFDCEPGEKRYVDIKTVVSNISGDILIDEPTNKSGLVNYPKYPVFNSLDESYVYYDNDPRFKDAYSRERFYYNLHPFTVERLADFSTDKLKFEGYLYSGGIFPPEVNKPLSVMPDYSLGFKVQSPPEGFPVYNNRGVFYNEVSLSMLGLQGTGTIHYLNTISQGTDIMFYLDSVDGVMDTFQIIEQKPPQVEFPSVTGNNISQNWRPYQDTMILSTIDKPLLLFDDKMELNGSLVFTPALLIGSGKQKFYTASTKSNHYTYGNNYFNADTLSINITNVSESEIAFDANRYQAEVSFQQGLGNFHSVNDSSTVNLPIIYYTSMPDEFVWNMNENEVILSSNKINQDVDISILTLRELIDVIPDGAKYISTHPLQDSLSFYSPEAKYDLVFNTFLAKDVKIIKVADAAVFPSDGIVEIFNRASVSPFSNAIIIADTANKMHQIIQADVNIHSRYSYAAKGLYEYRNLLDEVQIIEFEEIGVDTSFQTIASGHIIPEQSFMFSPQFSYRGKVFLNAREPLLDFEGAYKPIQDCDPELSRWVSFHQRIRPDSIVLPVELQPREFEYKKLYAGFFHSNEENRVYPTFLSRKAYYSDTLMLSVDGAVTTWNNGKKLVIASKSELSTIDRNNPSGPFISINNQNCLYKASGSVNFGTDYGQVSMQAFGQIEHHIIPDSTIFEVFIVFDFLFSEEALGFMKQSLEIVNKPGVKTSGPVPEIAYRQMFGAKQANEITYNLNTFGKLRKMPDELKKAIILSNVTMVYNPTTRSFISHGPIGVGFIQGESVNKFFDGYLEIKRKRSGDVVNLYIEADKRHWYFFTYANNMMLSVSAKNEYNKFITGVDSEKRKDKKNKDERGYRFGSSTSQAKNRFLRTMRMLETENE